MDTKPIPIFSGIFSKLKHQTGKTLFDYLIYRRDSMPVVLAPGAHDPFVTMTAESAGRMVDIHDRRPVVLTPELAREWLDPATPKERAEQMVLHQREPAEAFEWFKVDAAVGNVRNKGPELISEIR